MRHLVSLALLLAGEGALSQTAEAPPAIAPAVESLKPEREVDVVSRTEADARWDQAVVRSGSSICGENSWLRELSGLPADRMLRADSQDCVVTEFYLRNLGSRRLQCELLIELPDNDDAGISRYEKDAVVDASGMLRPLASVGPARLVPDRVESHCVVVPDSPPPIDVGKGCELEMTSPPIEDFYPVESRRREDTGATTLDFSLRDTKLHDVRVVSSSGNGLLDTGALDYARAARGVSKCPAQQRFRMRVVFQLKASKG